MLTGENGVLTKANNAEEETLKGQVKEEIELMTTDYVGRRFTGEEEDISNFNTSNVKNMSNMFRDCINLSTIYVTEYNDTMKKGWTTSNVGTSNNMFTNCTKIKGENNTGYDSAKIDKSYARIDKQEEPGYFTNIVNK